MTEREYLRHLNKSAQKFFPPEDKLPRGRAETLRQAKRFLKIKEQRIKQRHRTGLPSRGTPNQDSGSGDNARRTYFRHSGRGRSRLVSAACI